MKILLFFLSTNRLHVYDGNYTKLHNLTDPNFDGAFMTMLQTVEYFNLMNFPKIKILSTKQYVQLMPYCIHYRKHSSLYRPFNDQLYMYTSSGLIAAWARQFMKPPYKNDEMEPKPLSLHQVAGVVAVCIVMIGMSLFVFIFELIAARHEIVKSTVEFFTFKTRQRNNVNLQLISTRNWHSIQLPLKRRQLRCCGSPHK